MTLMGSGLFSLTRSRFPCRIMQAQPECRLWHWQPEYRAHSRDWQRAARHTAGLTTGRGQGNWPGYCHCDPVARAIIITQPDSPLPRYCTRQSEAQPVPSRKADNGPARWRHSVACTCKPG